MASMSANSSERNEQSAARVAAVVLAAGRSTRMGAQNKLLADLGGKPMVRRVVEAVLASKARPVLVVAGHQATDIAAALQGTLVSQIERMGSHNVPSPPVGEGQGGGESQTSNIGIPPTPSPSPQGGGESRHVTGKGSVREPPVGEAGGQPSSLDVTLVPNPDYATGLASSLRAGIRAVPADCDGALILLGDMPRIAPEHLDRLLDAFAAAPEAIVVPVHEGRHGNPVLWPRRHFADLMQLEGDAGAKRLIAAHREHVREVPMGTSAIFADVDTPEELTRLLKNAQ
jgi:CTP:molybdopterin cytidylyltransferase MocA